MASVPRSLERRIAQPRRHLPVSLSRLIAYYAFGEREGPGILLSVVCTVGLVYVIRKLRERQVSSHG